MISEGNEVDVLLATYNGELFLIDFLESLANQSNVKVNLIVGDDGSSDKTLTILKAFTDKFNTMQIFHHDNLGPSANFFALLKHSTSPYVAFADQDDIWTPSHLENSISRLRQSNVPFALTASAVKVFYSGKKTADEIWPLRLPELTFESFLFENHFRGCTIVLTRPVAQNVCLSNIDTSQIIMHDWWTTLVTFLIGSVIYSNVPEVEYRIHSNNFVGNGKPLMLKLSRFISFLMTGKHQLYSQISHLLELYENNMSQDDLQTLRFFENSLSKNFGFKKFTLIFYRKRLRVQLLSEIALRISFFKAWKYDR